MELSNPYESACWKTSDGIMRPGGAELTLRLLALSCLHSEANVLDLGCGCGASTELLTRQGFKAIGVDQSPALLKNARELYPHLHFVRGDATDIPFEDDTFDAVLLECVLTVAPVERVLAECWHVTCAQGLLLISDVYDMQGSGTQLSRAWWEMQLASNGFRYVYFEDRTRDLQNFAAQLLWDTGSVNGLCGCMSFELPAKPGYFALIAEKGER